MKSLGESKDEKKGGKEKKRTRKERKHILVICMLVGLLNKPRKAFCRVKKQKVLVPQNTL